MQSNPNPAAIAAHGPAGIEGDAGLTPAHPQAITAESSESSASVNETCQRAEARKPGTRRRQRDSLTARDLRIAALDASGTPVDAMVETERTSRSKVARLRARPDYQRACQAARGALVREADALRIAARHKALSAALAMLDGAAPDEALVRAVLSATTPDGHERDARVRAGLLRRLTPATRAAVVNELDGDGELTGLSDDELAAIAEGRS